MRSCLRDACMIEPGLGRGQMAGSRDLALPRVTSTTHSPAFGRTLPSMLARVRSPALLGIDAYLVGVETDIANGLPTCATGRLPHGAAKEARERVYASLANA